MGIIGAYRGEGKSTLIRQECYHLANQGLRVGLFSLEDPGDIASAGLVGRHKGISTFALDIGTATDTDIDAMADGFAELKDLPLRIVSQPLRIEQIVSTVDMMHAAAPLDIVFIDHIQYIMPLQLPGHNRNDTVAHYSMTISGLAKRHGIAIVVASQFSRDSEKKNRKPQLSDLRDSGSLEQDARQVVLLYYDGSEQCHVLEVAKNNYGQSRKSVKVVRMDGKQRFEALAKDETPSEHFAMDEWVDDIITH